MALRRTAICLIAMGISAIASIGGAFYSFTSTPSGLAIANVTSPNGNAGEITPYQGPADPSAGIQPIGSFNAWGPMDTLTVANVTVGGLPVTLLVGTSLGSLHVGTINAGGSVTSNASVALSGGFSYSVSVANVGNKAVVFSAEGSSGIRGYEFTGSALIPNGQSISGNYDYLVARGSYPSLILVAHKQFTGPMATFDTKWMLTGQTPVVGPTAQHEGSPDN